MLFRGNSQQMAQERFFRLAGVVGDMPAKFFAHLSLFGLGVGENRINDRGYLSTQGFEIRIDFGGPPVLLRPKARG